MLSDTKVFINTHAFSIILVSIVFSLIMIYNILGDVKYKQHGEKLSRVMIIEEIKNRLS